MLIVELPSEQYPDQLTRMQVDRAPAVAIFARGPSGKVQVWAEGRSMDTRFVLGWLNALLPSVLTSRPSSAASAPAAVTDPEVNLASDLPAPKIPDRIRPSIGRAGASDAE